LVDTAKDNLFYSNEKWHLETTFLDSLYPYKTFEKIVNFYQIICCKWVSRQPLRISRRSLFRRRPMYRIPIRWWWVQGFLILRRWDYSGYL